MSTATAIEVKVGALVLFSLALLVTFIVVLGDFGLKEGVRLQIDYADIGGLKPGASVKQAGIEIGKVQQIEYRGGQVDPQTNQPVWARVTIEVDPQFAPSIRTSSEFFITAEGVLGEKFIGIQTLKLDAPEAKAGHTFRGVDPMRIEQMVAKVSKSLDALDNLLNNSDVPIGDLVRHIDQLAVHVDEIIVENRPQIKELVGSAGGVMGKASALIDRTDTTIEHTDALILAASEVLAESRPKLRSILANVDTASQSAHETLALANSTMRRIDGLVAKADASLQPVIGDVRKSLEQVRLLTTKALSIIEHAEPSITKILSDAEAATANVQAITQDAAEMVSFIHSGKGTIGAFLRDEEIIDNVRETLREIKRRPWKIIWKE